MFAASTADVNAEFVTARRQSPLQGSNDTRRNARGVPVHAHDGTERLKPEGICEASQQLVPTIVMYDGLRHDGTEPDHPVRQPPRNVAAVERQIGACRPSCHYSYGACWSLQVDNRPVHALYYDWRVGTTQEMSRPVTNETGVPLLVPPSAWKGPIRALTVRPFAEQLSLSFPKIPAVSSAFSMRRSRRSQAIIWLTPILPFWFRPRTASRRQDWD